MAPMSPNNHTTGMFNNAHDNNFHNSAFVTNVKSVQAPSLDVLFKRVAPNAILNAGGRADEVKCHPGTRVEVINRIEKWADAKDVQTPPMFWLSGPAGAGKSAIMQTIAEGLDQRKAPEANFFFFRGDASRSHANPLVATLLHQIIRLNPSLKDSITTLLSANPLIFDASLENQLDDLIFTPLHTIQSSSSTYCPLILLIDGLDECDSEAKHTQARILLAFDQLFKRHSKACPVRLLVASRDESQIQMAFNKISTQCNTLYLDGQYSPAEDIRVFVKAQFAEVRKTHRLGHTLDANWPPVGDVDFIVNKSSGQFIYAATVMRFILGSSASPALNLDRVKGAEKFATHSPFSHLDAIYTYILSQVDDQTTLKEVLQTHFLLMEVKTVEKQSTPDYSMLDHIKNTQVFEIFDWHCSEERIRSCLEDVTSLAKYSSNRDLVFYHASFSDYILDESRSTSYFVDIPRLSSAIGLKVWKRARYEWAAGMLPSEIGMYLIVCMTDLPQELMSILAPTLLEWDADLLGYYEPVLTHLGKMCIRDSDIADFGRFTRARLRFNERRHSRYDFDQSKTIPLGRRYFQMARAEDFVAPDGEMLAAMYPDSDLDRYELSLWLNVLLKKIHQEIYPTDTTRYKELLKAWIDWAVLQNISLSNDPGNTNSLDPLQSVNLPHSRRYFAMASVDYRQIPDGETSSALLADSDSDRQELATWLNGLLGKSHQEIYPTDTARYKELLKAWIDWAVLHNVPLGNDSGSHDSADAPQSVNLPYSRRYFAMARAEHGHTPESELYDALLANSDLDRQELAVWFEVLLHKIHQKIYSTDTARYKELLKAWIAWAVSHDIPWGNNDRDNPNPGDRLQPVDLPYSRRYFVMARADYRQIPNSEISDALRPHSDAERQELALWLSCLLDQIHREIHSTNDPRNQELLKAWISWAVSNDIPCKGMVNLPSAQLYMWVVIAWRWVAHGYIWLWRMVNYFVNVLY